MSKYIIEIKPEYEDSFKGLMILGAKDSNLFVDTLAVENLEELNSDYINEHFGELQDTAYQRGLNDAWEAARKIIEMTDPPYWGVFNEYKDDLFGKISASEAIEKLKIYEEKQKVDDEIKIGDEVESLYDDRTIVENTIPWIVTKIREGYKGKKSYYGIDAEGTLRNNDFVRKTGRHFDIDKILKQMKVEEDFSDF